MTTPAAPRHELIEVALRLIVRADAAVAHAVDHCDYATHQRRVREREAAVEAASRLLDD
jgi:hypothetical protein